jgi:hypothetical protein
MNLKKKIRVVSFLIVFLLLNSFLAFQTTPSWNGIVDPSRALDWTTIHPGVTGGAIDELPDAAWANCTTSNCNTVFAGTVTQTSLQNALNTCPANQIIRLPAGSFTIAGGLDFNGANCELVGPGANSTFLTFSDNTCGVSGLTGCVTIGIAPSAQNYSGSLGNGPITVTGTFTKGQDTLTFASVPNLKVGGIFMIDQADDTTDNGGYFVSQTSSASITSSPVCGSAPCGPSQDGTNGGPVSLEGNSGPQRSQREQMEVLTVKSCGAVSTFGSSCTGTNVSVVFDPPLQDSNWSSSKTPQAWWVTDPIRNAGIKDLSIDVTNANSVDIGIGNATNVWVRGVRSIGSNRAHIQIDYSNHVTVDSNYLFLTVNAISQSYGVECTGATAVLVANNIMQGVASPMMVNGPCTGSAYVHNFFINNFYTGSSAFSIPGCLLHTAGITGVLIESNYGNACTEDLFHGSHNKNQFFRNRLSGPQPACWISGATYATSTFGQCTSSLASHQIHSYSRFSNYIGEILGTTGVNTGYETGTPVWDIGTGGFESGITVPSDPNVAVTIMRWGNADSATGFGSPRFNGSEVPTSLTGSQAAYSNAVPGSSTLPPSFIYTAKPAYWPNSIPWPAIGPDVTSGNLGLCTTGTWARGAVTDSAMCNGGTFSANTAGGHVNALPAQKCYLETMLGNPWGTSAVLPFDRKACYEVADVPPAIPTVPTGSGMFGRLNQWILDKINQIMKG